MTGTTTASPRRKPRTVSPKDFAVDLLERVCRLAGSADFIQGARVSLKEQGVSSAVRAHDTAALFDWLLTTLSYQGISDQVASSYMEQHGRATWRQIEKDLAARPSCPRLKSYWHFHGCRYSKSRYSCSEPTHLPHCPLPRHWLRNGQLNQTTYALFLFMRDVAGGDFVSWIDARLEAASSLSEHGGLARRKAALVDPLLNVHGVSDKVLSVALSDLLLGASGRRRAWIEIGGSMIAIDTLVHNFLWRSGILHRLTATHPYGPACYRPGGCADIIATAAGRIDARQFNPRFPRTFPRFVQHAVWRYCAQLGLDICNGNRIDDRQQCTNFNCTLYCICDKKILYFAD